MIGIKDHSCFIRILIINCYNCHMMVISRIVIRLWTNSVHSRMKFSLKVIQVSFRIRTIRIEIEKGKWLMMMWVVNAIECYKRHFRSRIRNRKYWKKCCNIVKLEGSFRWWTLRVSLIRVIDRRIFRNRRNRRK